MLYQSDWHDLLQSFTKPFTWLGLIGLTILVVLTATSNNWSVRRLGGKRWKWLHRLAHVAVAILIYDQSIAGKGHWYVSRWLLGWLLILQVARLKKIGQSGAPKRGSLNTDKSEADELNSIVQKATRLVRHSQDSDGGRVRCD